MKDCIIGNILIKTYFLMGFGVWGLGFGVWGLGFGVWGLGFGVFVGFDDFGVGLYMVCTWSLHGLAVAAWPARW